MEEFLAAGAYYENWLLAGAAVDYLAADNLSSPVQHFWSLAVEEQFYLAWPLLLVFAAFATRRISRATALHGPTILLVGVVALSFSYSVYLTATSPALAYFSPFTRAWEFAAGGILAIGLSQRQFGPKTAVLVSWVGLATILASSVWFTSGTPFPGVAAALPVAGALMVIAALDPTGAYSPDRVYRNRAVQWVGDASYSIYLWHWPLIVLVPFVSNRDLQFGDKIAIMSATVLVAGATRVLVEDRFRHSRRREETRVWPVYVAALAGMASVGVLAGAGWMYVNSQRNAVLAHAEVIGDGLEAMCFGAPSLDPALRDVCATVEWESVSPPRAAVGVDIPEAFRDECRTEPTRAEVKPCELGDTDSDFWVVLVGDSHAVQWAPTLEALADEHGWRLTVLYKAACGFTSAANRNKSEEYGPSCAQWNDDVMVWLSLHDPPNVVVTSAIANHQFLDDDGEPSAEVAVDGFARRYAALTARGTSVAVILDSPQVRKEDIECVANSDGLAGDCGRSPAGALSRPDYLTPATERVDGAFAVDLNGLMCVDDWCPSVIGSVVVYRDTSSHLTRTFASTLAPYLHEALTSAGALD